MIVFFFKPKIFQEYYISKVTLKWRNTIGEIPIDISDIINVSKI